jgi:hypothetical protein
VTFTDSGGHTVTVAASSGVAILTGFDDGPVSSVLNVTDIAGNVDVMAGGTDNDTYYVDMPVTW